jgi:hypothetical protein
MSTQEPHHLLEDTKVLRPLLHISKPEITHICKHNHIPFVIDPTNNDTTTSLRNKLRNSILPQLYALSHKQTSTTNSFIESMKHIYQQRESIIHQHQISLTSLKVSPYRHAKFAYQRKTFPHSITQEHIIQILNMLHIANNTNNARIQELTKFLKINESGYKFFNTTYFFKSHGNIYIISAPVGFRQKHIDKKHPIHSVENILRENQTYEISKKEYINAVLRYPQKGDTYKNKTRNQYCINQKIPLFQRNFVPIIAKGNQILKVYKPAIV